MLAVMRLALTVGRLDWRNVAKELTPDELAEWLAYGLVEPYGDQRADMRAAINSMFVASRFAPLPEDSLSVLVGYTDSLHSTETPVSPNQAAALTAQAFRELHGGGSR